MGCKNKTWAHPSSALCLAQQKSFCNLSALFASLCPGILFHFTAVIGSIQWLQTNEVDLLTLRIRQSSELNMNPEDRMIDSNVRELIYPKCLLCCDVACELTLYLCEILKHIFTLVGICIYSHFLLTISADYLYFNKYIH